MISAWWALAAFVAGLFIGSQLGILLLCVMMASVRRNERSVIDDGD